MDVRLAEICYLGMQNVSLRYLAHGYPTSVILTRGVKESILGEKLMKEIRNLGIDLDALAKAAIEKKTGKPLDTCTLELKTEALSRLAAIMVQQVADLVPTAALNSKRVSELEDELEKARSIKRSATDAELPTETTPTNVFKDGKGPSSHTAKAVNSWVAGLKLNILRRTSSTRTPNESLKACQRARPSLMTVRPNWCKWAFLSRWSQP